MSNFGKVVDGKTRLLSSATGFTFGSNKESVTTATAEESGTISRRNTETRNKKKDDNTGKVEEETQVQGFVSNMKRKFDAITNMTNFM